jgi:type I restriction enzyme S subunit
VRLGNISSYAETKQKVNATSADPSIWGLDLEDIEKGGRLLEHKTRLSQHKQDTYRL